MTNTLTADIDAILQHCGNGKGRMVAGGHIIRTVPESQVVGRSPLIEEALTLTARTEPNRKHTDERPAHHRPR